MNKEFIMDRLADKCTFGSDPEFFIRPIGQGTQPIPAYLSGVKGTKESPQELPNGGGIQVDGMALECNIPPSDNPVTFVHNLRETIQIVKDLLRVEGFQIYAENHVNFSEDLWDETPSEYKRLGCDPDYYLDQEAKRIVEYSPPQRPKDSTFATAGGHIHFGLFHTPIEDTNILKTTEYLRDNCFLAYAFETLMRFWSYEPNGWVRRSFYGKPTSFRPKSYGFEWRSPSNWWLKFQDDALVGRLKLLQDEVKYLTSNEKGGHPL